MWRYVILACCIAIVPELRISATAASNAWNSGMWSAFDTSMGVGRAHSSVVFIDASFLIIGGCRDPACEKQVAMVDRVDPVRQMFIEHFQLPITLKNELSGVKGSFTLVPLQLSGPTTTVRVDDTSGHQEPALYVVGACSNYYPEWQGSPESTLVQQQYNGIWHLSNDLKRMVHHFSIHPLFQDEGAAEISPVVLRANATCTTHGSLIFIIGGVNIFTGEALSTIDVFDTEKKLYVFNHIDLHLAVRNPLVAADSELIYIAGGEVPCAPFSADRASMLQLSFPNADASHNCVKSSAAFARPWCLTSSVRKIFRVSGMEKRGSEVESDTSLPLFGLGHLPSNPELTFSRNGAGGVFLAQKRYMFVFDGKLCLFLNSTFLNCLDVEQLLRYDAKPIVKVRWFPLSWTIFSPPVVSSTPFAFTLSAGMLGAMLVLFEIGGFDADGMASRRAFFRTTHEYVRTVPRLDAVVFIGKPLNLSLSPPVDGYVRLSSDPVCVGNAAGTDDVQVFQRQDEATVAVFLPKSEGNHVYVCFANFPVWLPCVNSSPDGPTRMALLFTPITITPFRIHKNHYPEYKTGEDPHMLLVGVVFGVLTGIAVATILAVVFVRLQWPPGASSGFSIALLDDDDGEAAGYFEESEENEELGEKKSRADVDQEEEMKGRMGGRRKDAFLIEEADCMARGAVYINALGRAPHASSTRRNSKTNQDCLVKNTTNSSRYEVVRRIGEGAFSSVYLVRRRHDKQRFALKYLICSDNKERLDAIRECETINSVQGHPNIIRLVEMFMNYEFDGGHHLLPPSQETVTPVFGFSLPQWDVIRGKKPENNPCTEISCGVPDTGVTVVQQQQPLEAGRSPPCVNAASFGDSRRMSEHHNIVVYSKRKGRSTLDGVDAQRVVFELEPCQPMQWEAGQNVNGSAIDTQAVFLENSPPPPPPPAASAAPALSASTLKPETLLVVCGGKSPLLQDPGTTPQEERSRLQTPDPGVSETLMQTAPTQQRDSLHYCNFVGVSQVKLPPFILEAQRRSSPKRQEHKPVLPERHTTHAPCVGIHYKDFDITSATSARAPLVQIPQRKDSIVPSTAAQTPLPICYAQSSTRNIQYTNFAATHSGPREKPKSVADAIRAARAPQRGDGKMGAVKQMEQLPSPIAEAPNICSPKQQEERQPPKKKEPEEIKCAPFIHGFPIAPTAHHKKPLVAVGSMAKKAALGTSYTGPVHTRYLCLVMEYHPMGDLCRYVLRHSAKTNEELRRQLENEKRVREGSVRNLAVDTSSRVRFTSGDHNMPSIFHPGKSSRNPSHDIKSSTSLDRLNFSSNNATLGSGSCNNMDVNNTLCMDIETEFAMRANALSEPQLLSIAYQLASVLHHLHSQRPPIVHRDLKPENILIRGEPSQVFGNEDDAGTEVDGSDVPLRKGHRQSPPQCNFFTKLTLDFIPIVVTDFGLAFLQEDRRSAGRGGGTRPYIAPECWGGQTTTASDVWSLGCVLYALATARLTVQTVRIMYEEAKHDGFAAMVMNDILAEKYSLAFASFVVSLLVVPSSKRPTAEMVTQCFKVDTDDGVVRFDPNCPFFSNVLDL